MSAMNSSDRWHSDLAVPKTGSLLGIVTAIYTIGNMTGSFVAGPAGDRWGRKVGMVIGNSITLVGAIVLFSARNHHAFLAGRFLTGFGLSISRSSAPSWVAEMSPPQWRGPAIMLYNSLWLIGAIIASAIAFASGPIQSSLSWRLPLIIQVVPTSIVLLGVWFLPESPRWLIANDRLDDACRILTKYHADGDENSSLVSLEIAEMQESIKLEASDKRWYDYSEFVSTPGNRYRLFMVVSIGFIGITSFSSVIINTSDLHLLLGQWGGSNLTGYYLANNLRNIGITAQNRLLVYNMAYYISALGGASIGSLLSNKIGRRPQLLFGCLSMSACLVALIGVTSQYHKGESSSLSNLTIAFIFFVGIFHSGGVNPLVVAYPVECLHTNTRSKGMGINNLVLNAAEFVNTYAAPIALANIAWKIYIVYAVWNIVQAVWVYVFFVETKDRTLEEMDEIFKAKNPVTASLKDARVSGFDGGI